MTKTIAALMLFIAGCSAAAAQDCFDYDIYDAGRTYPGARLIVNYIADIQEQDTYNSQGAKLLGAEEVMRQDRANVHKFGLASDMDTRDGFFGRPDNRALLTSAQYITYCGTDLNELKQNILQGRVPGLIEVVLFKMLISERYVVFINVVG